MNARKELVEEIRRHAVKCAIIEHEGESHLLRVGHSEKDLEDFLNGLDFVYDNGYGGQELFGLVWLEGGAWLERGEYDGSEWWEFKRTPTIPEGLR